MLLMVLRKITTENIVRYIPISEKTKETDIKPKRAGSLLRKPNKKNFTKQQKNSSKIF